MAVAAGRRALTGIAVALGLLVAGAGLPAGSALPLAPAAAAAAAALGQPRFGTPTTLPGYGNPAGGLPATTGCGPQALTALTGYHDDAADYLRGVSAACSPVLSDGSAASLGAPATGGSIGRTSAPVSETSACPAGALATGVQGRDGLLVDQVQLLCSPLGADGTLGAAQPAPVATGGSAGAARPPVACPAGSVVVGLHGRSGDGLDYLAVDCAGLAFVTDAALHFAGGTTSGRVAVDYDPALEQPTDFTLEADVRWDGTPGLRGIVSQPRSDGVGNGLAEGEALVLSDGRPCLSMFAGLYSDGTLRRTCAAAPLPAGTWVHVAVSYDGSTSRVVVDGVTTTQVWPLRLPIQFGENAPMVIGRLFATDVENGTPAASLSGFGGDLDNVKVSSGAAPAPLTTLLDLRLDEGSGTTTLDAGPGAHVGRLVAATPADLPTWVTPDRTATPDNTSWPTALTITAGTPVDGALLRPGEARWYRFPVQPDARVSVDVTGLPADYDVTLFKDIGQAFSTLTTPSDLNRLGAEFAGDAYAPSVFSPSVFSPSVFSPSVFSPSVFSPSVFSPSVFSPSVFSPSVFSPSVFSPSVFSPSVFSPSVFSPSVFSPSVFSPSVFSPSVFSPSVFSQAFSSAQTRSIIAVSAHDGLADENVTSATWADTGYFYVRVIGRGGASSPNAYHLRLTGTGGACTSTLDPRTDLATVTGTPGGATTVILTDYSRMHGTAADLATVRDRVGALASATGGVVVDLGTVPRLVALNAQADAVKDCPYAKNLVAQAARDVVNGYRDGTGTLKYVVLVGGDDVVPFFRYPDAAGLGPENGYVPPVADSTASQASLRRNTFLSQDAYGAAVDVSVKGSVLPVPDLAVGRLVETPAEISGTIADYLGLPGGALPTASSSLVTGYDFLADAADTVERTLSAGIPQGRNDTLVTDQGVPPTTTTGPGGPSRSTSWTAADLRTALLGSRHDITFLAGHFSANSALAADYSTSLLTTDLAAAPAGTFRDTVVISAGCHSGYNLLDGDGVPGLTLGLDWAQAFAQQGATLVAGTGYQYGDTDFVEYSERLYADLATELRVGTGPVALGAALTRAKQDYLEGTAQVRGIHTKALLEATLFGLPMLGVDLPSRVSAPADPSVVAPVPVTAGPGAATLASGAPGLGLSVADLAVTPQLTRVTRALTGTDGSSVTATYLTGPDGVVTDPAEPALPLDSLNVSVPGRSLRGVGLRSGTYTDTTGITPLTGAATTETNSVHAPFVSAAFFPSRLATPNYFDAIAHPADGVTRLAVTPAQHRSDGPGSATSTLRSYSALGLRLFYSADIATYGGNTPALAAPPSIGPVGSDAVPDGGSVPVRVHVTGDPSAGVQQVWVTYTGQAGSPLHGTWASVDLQQDGTDSTLWTGLVALPAGQRSADVRFEVQAVDGVGLVSADDDQGGYYTPGQADPATAPLTAPAPSTLVLTAPASGSYGSAVHATATLTATAGGAPLAGRTVSFGLGGSSVTAVTGANGVAAADVPLLVVPGVYPLQASFDGDAAAGAVAGYAASASAPSALTVGKQPTALALTGPATPPAPGQDSGVAATLTAAGLPVRAHTVYLAVADAAGVTRAAATRITDVAGRVLLGPLGLPAGAYTVTASFGGTVTLPSGATTSLDDPVLAPATATLPLSLGAPPTLAGSPPAATAGTPYRYAFTVGGSPAPTVRVTSGQLPAGLALAPSGVLSGTPTAAGTFVVTLTADNGRPPAATLTATLVVAPGAPSSVAATSGGGQVGTAGQPFDRRLAVTVVDRFGNPVPGASVTFAVTSGSAAFPDGARTTAVTGPTGVATAPVLTAGRTAGPVTVTATAGTGAGAPSAAFALSVVTVTAARADLQVAVAAPASVVHGGTLVVTVSVTNRGPNTAASVATVLTLGAHLVVVSAPGATVSGKVLTYAAPGLAVGATVTWTVTLRADDTHPVTSGAAAATLSAVPDPQLRNNAAAVAVKIT